MTFFRIYSFWNTRLNKFVAKVGMNSQQFEASSEDQETAERELVNALIKDLQSYEKTNNSGS